MIDVCGVCHCSVSAILDGLALDEVAAKLYYCDAGNSSKIAEVTTDGKHHRVLYRQAGMQPRGIALDVANR